MTLNLNSFLETIDSVSPASARFTVDTAHASLPLQLLNPTISDMQDALTTILGGTDVDVRDGRLARILPIAHPMFPWLTAASIDSIRGVGASVKTASASKLEVSPLPYVALYPQYEFTVGFTQQPYALLQDASITLQNGQTWYSPDGTANPNTVYAQEWLRFTDYELMAHPENITAQFGQMLFRTQSGAAPGNGVQFAGQPKIFLNSQTLRIRWFQVPWRYVESDNSWIRSQIGTINQFDFWRWKAGELLYLNYEPKRYTPPVPQLETLDNIVTTRKLCDITFTFLYTKRTVLDAPTTPLANPSFIPAGWNALPWLQNRSGFFYASTDNAAAASQYPTYNSFPMQLLFTDPDV